MYTEPVLVLLVHVDRRYASRELASYVATCSYSYRALFSYRSRVPLLRYEHLHCMPLFRSSYRYMQVDPYTVQLYVHVPGIVRCRIRGNDLRNGGGA